MGVQDEEMPVLVPPVLVKGKRSKRQRVHALPVQLAPEWSSSAASAATAPALVAAVGGEEEDSGATSRSAAASASVSVAVADDAASSGCVTEEDEDMALCLMLLANGVPAGAGKAARGNKDAEVKEARFRSRRPAADGAAAGEYVYECKTCNKCFPSFQALGGHRTSHKKPRLLLPPPSEDKGPAAAAAEAAAPAPAPLPPPSPPPPAQQATAAADETVPPLAIPVGVPAAVVPKQEQDAPVAIATIATAAAASSSSKHPRVHECSICGAEFGSGQALGGHMRRHRPLVPAAARDDAAAPRKEKSLLELDLNMPAPCDEAEAPATAVTTSPRFAFTAERPPAPLLFPGAAAASALVDCRPLLVNTN